MNPATTSMGGLTVIIPSLGRPHTLHDTVASLLRQTAPPEEIILVVPDLAHVDAATLAAPRVRAIPSPMGICHQRNAGIRARNRAHPFVAFFDDDVELHPRYLEAARAALRADQDAVLLTGLVLRDGAKTGGIGRAAALAAIAAADPIATELVTPVRMAAAPGSPSAIHRL
jgi:glycosyltransferase involved in cell wall biosynthesis